MRRTASRAVRRIREQAPVDVGHEINFRKGIVLQPQPLFDDATGSQVLVHSTAPGTGSAPRRSTQHGTFPFGNWNGANHSMNSRTSSVRPMRSSPVEVSAPSRIQERA